MATLRLLLALALLPPSAAAASPARLLYAVDAAGQDRGAISVYDIDSGHRLLRTIATVPHVGDVRGVAAAAVTGRLYASYVDIGGAGRIYCLDLAGGRILWDRAVAPSVDRLAITPDGRLLYVPAGEGRAADFLNIVDAANGAVLRQVHFSNHLHDTLYPLSGPLFQTTKASDGTGAYLYLVDPKSDAVSRIGPYRGVLGPYAVDGKSRHVVNNVTGLWGMQVADLESGEIATAAIAEHPPGGPGLLHGIGWTPDESEVWQNGRWGEPHVYVWDMRAPMRPVFRQTLALRSGHGAHWLTFTISGDYAYIAPDKNSSDPTEIFDTRTHHSAGTIAASEDMLEIDFDGGRVSQVGDQYGIGRRR